MNNTTLEEIEQRNQEKLKEYKLDCESIKKCQEELEKVPEQESERLGKLLFDMISDKRYNGNIFDGALDLVYKGANVNYKEENKGDFPLLICARRGYLHTFYMLIRAGANVNLKNYYLTTATMAAARHGYDKMVEILILMGADVNAKCKDGDTALISAKRHNRTGCVIKLINAQAHINAKNLSNQTFMDIGDSLNFKNFLIDENKKKYVTNQDALNLIEEAKAKFNKIKGN